MSNLLRPRINGPDRLRQLLERPEPLLAPGAYDALSARLIEEAGFPAVYMTGFGIAASLLGRPDVGLVTMSEMAEAAARIAQAVNLPVIADADTGYGNAINVIRTVQTFQAAGVAAIQLEDQVLPKRCGHMSGKQVISSAEMAGKIEAAVAARGPDGPLIIARTDARAVEGMDAAIKRADRYRAAGADLLFVEAPESEAEIEHVARALSDTPLVFNWAEGGKTPPVTLARLSEFGFRIVIFPVSTLLAATHAIRGILAALRTGGTPMPYMERLTPFAEFLSFVGLSEIDALGEQFKG